MNDFLRQHRKLTALGTVPVLLMGCWLVLSAWCMTAPVCGRVAARIDLARGHYERQSVGLAFPWRPQYAALLRQRYDIEQRTVAGCMVTESLGSYVSAYNEVVRAAALRKFGRDVFAECAANAETLWRSQEKPL